MLVQKTRKKISVQPILQLLVERNSPSDDQLSSSKRIKKIYIQKNQIKKTKHKIITDDDDWLCTDCDEVYDDGRDCCWITCDICISNYQLECLEIQYPKEHYFPIYYFPNIYSSSLFICHVFFACSYFISPKYFYLFLQKVLLIKKNWYVKVAAFVWDDLDKYSWLYKSLESGNETKISAKRCHSVKSKYLENKKKAL